MKSDYNTKGKSMYTSSNNILTREDCSLTPILPNSNRGVKVESKGVKFKESEAMVYGYIYKIVNTINKKVYIGQTTQKPSARKSNHLNDLKNGRHKNPHLQSAFNKYSESVFEFIVLNYATNKDTLDKLEEEYITHYDSLNRDKGYNLRSGGSNGKLSEETRKKLSEINKGENNPMYGRKGPLSPHYGKKPSPETCRKIGLGNKGKKISEATRVKIGEWQRGKSLSEETRKKISDAKGGENHHFYGKKLSEEHRRNISNANKGQKHDDETKKRISESKMGEKNYWYGKNFSKEHREKISKNNGRYWEGKKFSKEHIKNMVLSRRGRGRFGFTGAYFKKTKGRKPFHRQWQCKITYNNYSTSLAHFEDPLSCQIVYDIVFNEIWGKSNG